MKVLEAVPVESRALAPGTEEKILVLGASGSGKTTFSRKLGKCLDLEVIHLDSHFWQENWQPAAPQVWDEIVARLLGAGAWIMDGNYPQSLSLRLERATAVVLLDLPRRLCLYRCFKRLFQNWGQTREELAPGCREKMDWELFKWIWSFPHVVRPDILAQLEDLPAEKKVFILKSGTEIEKFLKGLSPAAPAAGSLSPRNSNVR